MPPYCSSVLTHTCSFQRNCIERPRRSFVCKLVVALAGRCSWKHDLSAAVCWLELDLGCQPARKQRPSCGIMAMPPRDSMVEVTVWTGRCPVGGCAHDGRVLCKSYVGEEDLKAKVANHLVASTYHSMSEVDAEGVLEDVPAWCETHVESYTQQEMQDWQSWQASQARGGALCKQRPQKRHRDADDGPAASSTVSRTLTGQIQQQTVNALAFSKAAANAVKALRTSARLAQQAADTFNLEAGVVERGVQEMTAAFGNFVYHYSYKPHVYFEGAMCEHVYVRFFCMRGWASQNARELNNARMQQQPLAPPCPSEPRHRHGRCVRRQLIFWQRFWSGSLASPLASPLASSQWTSLSAGGLRRFFLAHAALADD